MTVINDADQLNRIILHRQICDLCQITYAVECNFIYPFIIQVVEQHSDFLKRAPVESNGGKFEITDVQLSEESNIYSCETQNAEGRGPTEQLQITVLGKYQDYLTACLSFH